MESRSQGVPHQGITEAIPERTTVYFDHFSKRIQPNPIRILLLVSSVSICSHSTSQSTNHFSEQSHAQLMETAERLRTDGNFSEAEVVFKQLFNSVRANGGLFHEHQFGVLDRLIQINLANADWQNLKQHLDYHDWLLKRLYADDALLLAQHLERNAAYHEQASQETIGPARNWHLVQTRQQLWRAVSALETLPGEAHRLPPLLQKIVMLHYALSRQNDLRWLTSFETRSDEPAMISGWAMQGSDISKRSYEIGAELILRIINHYKLNADSDPAAQAALLSQLMAYRGDWEMLFGRERYAKKFYEESLSLTELSSCKDLLRQALFENLVQLPVPTLALRTDICSTIQYGHNDPLPRSAQIDTQSGIYRPQWQQDDWLMTSPPAVLSALDTGNQYD